MRHQAAFPVLIPFEDKSDVSAALWGWGPLQAIYVGIDVAQTFRVLIEDIALRKELSTQQQRLSCYLVPVNSMAIAQPRDTASRSCSRITLRLAHSSRASERASERRSARQAFLPFGPSLGRM